MVRSGWCGLFSPRAFIPLIIPTLKFLLWCVNLLYSLFYSQNLGFSHSAFTFAHESLVVKSSTAQTEIPPGALITFLQKGLEYIAIEEHINEVRCFAL